MAYCPNCGSSVEGRFCAKCGTAMPAAGPAAPPPAAPYGTPPGPPPPAYGAPQAAPTPAYGPPPTPPPAYGQAPAPPPPSYGPGPGAPPPPPGYGTGAPPPPPGYAQQPGYPPQGQPYAQAPGMQENVASALCYLLGWITGIIFLVVAPYNQNRNVKFHAWQSIFFSGGLTVVFIVLRVISGIILSTFSLGLWTLFNMLILIFDLACLAAWLFLMFKAYNNQRFVLPIVGPLAEKQAYSS